MLAGTAREMGQLTLMQSCPELTIKRSVLTESAAERFRGKKQHIKVARENSNMILIEFW